MAKRICKTCGNHFEHRKKVSYCSKSCDPKRTKTCPTCGKSFVDETRANRVKFCSDACNPNHKSRSKVCAHCQSTYEDTSSNNSTSYCSKECGYKAKALRQDPDHVFLDETDKTCLQCDKSFNPSASNQKYCSELCREISRIEALYEDVPGHLSRKVQCLDCGEVFFGCISHSGPFHHLLEHGLTAQEYLEKYPKASLYCEASLWKQSQKSWTMSPGAKEATVERLKAYQETHGSWNRGLTKDDHPSLQAISDKATVRLSVPENNPFFGKSHTPETLETLSQATKQLWKDPDFKVKYWESKKSFFEEGQLVSNLHQTYIDAMKARGIWEGFDTEVFITRLDGMPHPIDLAHKERKIAIEIDGCFYHNCPEHGRYNQLSETWQKVLRDTQWKDHCVSQTLLYHGWTVFRFWEHEDVETNLDRLTQWLYSSFESPTSFDDYIVFYAQRGFPYYRYSQKEMLDDYTKLCGTSIREPDHNTWSLQYRSGMKAVNFHTPHLFDVSTKKMSAIEYFRKHLDKLVVNRLKYADRMTDSTMRTGVKILTHQAKSFPSYVSRDIYAHFLPDGGKVWDPCLGFGGRMVGACSLGLHYYGSDTWIKQVDSARRVANLLDINPELFWGSFEDMPLEEAYFDLVFTSPPHYDKEHYDRTYPSYDIWMDTFMKPLIEKSWKVLKPGACLVLHLTKVDSNDLPTDTERLMRDIGFEVQPRFGIRYRNFHHDLNQKEPLLIARKGNPL